MLQQRRFMNTSGAMLVAQSEFASNIYSISLIAEREVQRARGRFQSRDLIPHCINTLAAGDRSVVI